MAAFAWGPPFPFGYTVTNGQLTIANLIGPMQVASIPNQVNGYPVTGIATNVFQGLTNLLSVTIPGSVTSVAPYTFGGCSGLTNVSIGQGVSNIGLYAFQKCTGLTNIIIPASVATVGSYAFFACTNLKAVYFTGNAPAGDSTVFFADPNATVYYLPGMTGWGSTFGGAPTAVWTMANPEILNNGPGFGFQTNHFAFTISWATNEPVVVQVTTNLTNPTWTPVSTNTLSNGVFYFSEPAQTNVAARFYRVVSP